jgi:predicted ATPase
MGYSDQSLTRSREALVAAQSIGHPYSLAFCLYFSCLLHLLRDEPEMVAKKSRDLTELAAEQGFTWWSAAGTFFQGWAMSEDDSEDDSPEARVTRMREGFQARKPASAMLLIPFFLGQIAWALARLNRAAEGLPLLAEAIARIEETGERWYEAEVHRLRGELLLTMPGRAQGEVEACFQRAIAVAKEQSARLWELRATMSLARQWRDQDRRADARNLLAPIYGWFTEGFDSADLRKAKAFFDQL